MYLLAPVFGLLSEPSSGTVSAAAPPTAPASPPDAGRRQGAAGGRRSLHSTRF